MLANGVEHVVRHAGSLADRVDVGESGALGLVEELRRTPVLQRLAFLDRNAVRHRNRRHVLLQRVGVVRGLRDPHDGKLAQPRRDRGAPADRADVLEPGHADLGRVQQQLVDVDQRAAPALDLADLGGELGVVLLLDV